MKSKEKLCADTCEDVAVALEHICDYAAAEQTPTELNTPDSVSWLELFNRMGEDEVEVLITGLFNAMQDYTEWRDVPYAG
jgi:hypothetical protein